MTAELFADRHIGPGPDDERRMLDTVGYASIDELMDAAIPEVIRWHGRLDLPPPASEPEALAELRALAARNTVAVSMIGLGYHGTHTPAVIRRNVLESPAWYTAHAVSAGDQPGAAGGVAELPDHGVGSDRSGDRERVDARRGHRRGGGDDPGAAGVEERQPGVRGRRGRAAADHRGDRRAG
ncbi:hypothetical protein GCM10029963_09270 [Micromonospora andamanensis]